MEQDYIKSEIEKTIESDDSMPALNLNPFLYERVKAEIDMKKRDKIIHTGRAKLVQALLIVLFAVNILAVYFLIDSDKKRLNHEQLIHELKKEFQIETAKNIF